MARYQVNHSYRSNGYGPYTEGDIADLDIDTADWVNRDSPGCLTALDDPVVVHDFGSELDDPPVDTENDATPVDAELEPVPEPETGPDPDPEPEVDGEIASQTRRRSKGAGRGA